MIHRGHTNSNSNNIATAAAAAAATMAWCSARGSMSGHSMRMNMTDLYTSLFSIRDPVTRDALSRDTLSREALSRLTMTGKPPLLLLQAIRCTHSGCPCECFAPGKQSIRQCETCNHGWVAHALDKLGATHVMNLGLQVEVVQPNIVFDIASLMLYGAHATPVRLKILLDRLFSVLQHEEVLQVLHGFGWTYEDYARGYVLQDSSGRVLDKWCMTSREEEMVVLQQFLRFGETKAIAQEIILQDTKERHDVLVKQSPRADSDIKKFIERSNLSMQSYLKSYESTRQLFGSRTLPFLTPPTTRMMTSPIISPNYSPSREPRATIISMPQTPPTSTPSLATPPLNRLQPIQQPFDARKEQINTAVNLTQAVNLTAAATIDKTPARSPACDSPKNLSTASTPASSASISPIHQLQRPQIIQQQQLQQQDDQGHTSGDDEVDGSISYLSESEEEGEVIDYSHKDNPDSPFDDKKNGKQHSRKSSNPIKRQWTPSANFGSTLIGPNGKKRVLCTACNKTFCDKGALKIHYSAVHLKEMHKCSVEGCNMMFSSRRSRNRHSANPNPKLHMPQKRKDELEESVKLEMATCIGNSGTPTVVQTPVVTVSALATLAPQPVVSTATAVPILEAPRIIRPDSAFFVEMSSQFPFLPPPEKRAKLGLEDGPTDLSKLVPAKVNVVNFPVTHNGSAKIVEEEPCDLSSKKFDLMERKLEIDLDASCSNEQISKLPESISPDDEGFKSFNGVKAGSRRKNNAPIRCAIKPEILTVNTPECFDPHSMPKLNTPADFSIHLNSFRDTSSKISTGPIVINIEGASTLKTEESKESDTVEKAFCNFSLGKESSGSNQHENFLTIPSPVCKIETDSFHKMSMQKEGDDGDDEQYDEDDDEDDDNDDADLEEEGKMVILEKEIDESQDKSDGEASLLSNDSFVECPPDFADKENPLKCAACGKVFQNSFTVKIHYQNVHLKVMHECKVEGCAAAFPSKRSRDRHSANVNLHRRLLAGETTALDELDAAMKGNILARLYGHDLVNNATTTITATPPLAPITTTTTTTTTSSSDPNKMTLSLDDTAQQQPAPTTQPHQHQPLPTTQPHQHHDNTLNNNIIIINNNNNDLKLDENEIRVFTTTKNDTKFPNGREDSSTPSLKMSLPANLNGRVSKAGSAGSEALSEDSDGNEDGKDEKNGFMEQTVFSNPLKLQDHITVVCADDNDKMLPDEVLPRRNRNRHKRRNVSPSSQKTNV